MKGVKKHTATKSRTEVQEQEGSLSLVQSEEPEPISIAPLVSSCNDGIRPVLDAVDKLRHLMITKEGIQLPTIVVVGDQSSGKSSVLESLAGISLPRGQGICTRVPLVMRLQNHPKEPDLTLEYNCKIISTDEAHISEAINTATEELAGNGKGISDNPLTLVVKKNGVPDLTMVDLPGITRVPVHGQPENIYDQIKDIIMQYMKPEESIILNVLSATVDFPTCESIRMSQSVDKTGLRTLAVVTKADKAPEGLLEKVTSDDVNIGLGYVCVRNGIGDETYEEARMEEAKLFEFHPLLSKIDKSIVGIPVLAQKLVQIQAASLSKNLPDIVKKINDKLNANLSELNKMPKNMSSVADALTAFMRIIGLSKESLKKILVRGEFDEYPDEKHMHCTARLVEKLDSYSSRLHQCAESDPTKNFLMEEIGVLEEAKFIGLPNFLPRVAFLTILQRKVKGISSMPIGFVEDVWNYIEDVVISVLNRHSENYYQLQMSIRPAGHNLVSKMKEKSINHVMELVDREKLTDYTCNPEYMAEFNRLMSQQDAFFKDVLVNEKKSSFVMLQGVGTINVEVLRQYAHVLQQAFDLKMRMIAYWKIVLRRLVDCMALHLQFSIDNLVNKDFDVEIVKDLMSLKGYGIERLLEESPSVAGKREKLNRSVKVLRHSKEVVANIMDRIASYGD
ncbi:Dynamin-related protein 4c-like [Quillaja saponaria]|uniref:Dynamin-related protein 4c-like n=1 Tax=Quillaja saponaria TaxID=32244 RepID=A0AAD7PA08_QUISA|nr:Dynamin-related protein 4c-like [Quillaja saponaria]